MLASSKDALLFKDAKCEPSDACHDKNGYPMMSWLASPKNGFKGAGPSSVELAVTGKATDRVTAAYAGCIR